MIFSYPSFFRVVIIFLIAGGLSVATCYYQYRFSVSAFEEKVFEQALQRTHGLVIKQREIVRAKLFELDRILLTLRDAIQHERFSQHQLEELMQLQKTYHTEIADFLLLDAEGKMLAWTRPEPMPHVEDRDYFQWHLQHPSDTIFLSSIQEARVEEPFPFFALSRKVSDSQQQLTGVIVATVDIAKLSKALDDELFDGRLTNVLVKDDSSIIFRLPFAANFINQRLESLEKYGASIPDQDSYFIKSPFDDITRLVTFQRVPDWPLIVFIGENMNYSFGLIAEFKLKEQKRWGSFSGLVLALGLVILWLLKRRFDNGQQIAEQRKELEDYYHRHRAILEAMPDLVFTIDKSGTILNYQSSNQELAYTSPERLVGHSFVEALTPEVSEQGIQLFHEVLNTGITQHFEYPLNLNGQALYFELRMSKIDDEHILAIARDITSRKESEAQLTWQATHDALTKLPNRVLFYDRLEHAVAQSKRSSVPFALLYIDIDGFKPVNDTLGHNLGDQLLVSFAQRIRARLRESDTFARLAGDEFAIILFDCQSARHAHELINEMIKLIEVPFVIGNHQIHISASIGLVWSARWEQGIDTLVNQADQEMYQNKERRKQQNKLP